MSNTFSVKTCVIGSQGVGKTSMIFQLSMKQFKINVTPTIGASFSCKVIDVDSYTVRFQIWDTAGQETYKSMLPMYYRKANLAMAVYDITCYESFLSLPKWIDELKKNVDNECVICIIGNKCDLEHKRAVDRNKAALFAKSIGALYFETSAKTLIKKNVDNECVICIIGNKCDLEHKRAVDRNKAALFAKSIGALYFETSAKTNEGIMEAFIHIARQLINAHQKRRKSSTPSLENQPVIQMQSEEEEKKSSCC